EIIKEDMKEKSQLEGGYVGKRHSWLHKLFSLIVFTFALMGFLFLLDSITGSIFEPSLVSSMPEKNSSDALGDDGSKNVVQMYGRLASMASSALVEVLLFL
nr:O-fucosyltransferase 8 isoform X1 [Tanacetum cinerariifolium]